MKEILEITKKFHDTYEKLANEYNYETRKETRVFDINSNNGKLMYATVNEIISPILEENQELKKQFEEITDYYCEASNIKWERAKRIIELKTQQKEFIKYLEDEIKEEKDNLEKLCELCKIPKGNNGAYKFAYSYIKKIEEILQKYKEKIGVSNDY